MGDRLDGYDGWNSRPATRLSLRDIFDWNLFIQAVRDMVLIVVHRSHEVSCPIEDSAAPLKYERVSQPSLQ